MFCTFITIKDLAYKNMLLIVMTHWPVSAKGWLAPKAGQSVILFWCQKSASDTACSVSCLKPARKLNCDWSVRADDSTACLFVNKDDRRSEVMTDENLFQLMKQYEKMNFCIMHH